MELRANRGPVAYPDPNGSHIDDVWFEDNAGNRITQIGPNTQFKIRVACTLTNTTTGVIVAWQGICTFFCKELASLHRYDQTVISAKTITPIFYSRRNVSGQDSWLVSPASGYSALNFDIKIWGNDNQSAAIPPVSNWSI
jgi:hypothetical protein